MSTAFEIDRVEPAFARGYRRDFSRSVVNERRTALIEQYGIPCLYQRGNVHRVGSVSSLAF